MSKAVLQYRGKLVSDNDYRQFFINKHSSSAADSVYNLEIMTRETPNYTIVENVLDQLDSDITASEAHGALCGLLCSGSQNALTSWVYYITPETDSSNVLHSEAKNFLDNVYQETFQQLNDPLCDFQLLLPNDEELNIEDRVYTLGDWCQGFLAGLSMGGVKDFRHLPSDSSEISHDIVEIARAGSSYQLQDTEDDEIALQELIEYVRVGVLLLNEEMNPTSDSPRDQSKLH